MGLGQRRQEQVVRRYIAALNARDIQAMEDLFGESCKLIDSVGGSIEGRDDCIEASRRFFDLEPAFAIAIDTLAAHAGEVLVTGTASAKEPMLRRDRLWRARSDGKHLLEWQSYGEDSRMPLAQILMGDKARRPG